jgi:hypothetical protein
MVRPRFYRNPIDSPGTESRAVRGRTRIPGDHSPGAALCAVRASGCHARQGWFGRTDTFGLSALKILKSRTPGNTNLSAMLF